MMWQRVYDSGTLLSEQGEREGRLVVQDFPFNRAVCGRITGWFEFISRRSAASATTIHHCRCDDAAQCSWEFHW